MRQGFIGYYHRLAVLITIVATLSFAAPLYSVAGQDFVEEESLLQGVISGYCFNDENQNGKMDESEAGLPGVSVSLTKLFLFVFSIPMGTVATDAEGRYEFADLGIGNYRIEADVAEGSQCTSTSPVQTWLGIFQKTFSCNFGLFQGQMPPPAVSVSMSASPMKIKLGESTTLIWTSENAVSASIDQSIGEVDLEGSVEVSPEKTTKYTVTAEGEEGSIAKASVTVTVESEAPPPEDTTTIASSSTTTAPAAGGGGGGSGSNPPATTSIGPSTSTTSVPSTTTTSNNLPPDPEGVAPPLDATMATDMHTAIEFLYTGDNPIQTGVAPGTMEARRIAVLRGKIMNRNGDPLPGVTITVLDHPEYGQTLSRADGMFDMAVNGGGVLTVNYYKNAYLPAQRQVNAPWQGFAQCPDAALVPLDSEETELYFPAGEMQIARGSQIADEDGTRRVTLLIPDATEAELVFADGHAQAVNSLNVRFTEYTVGINGPEAMPAELPPTSAYTYAVELSADEAIAAGADHVQFSKPVFLYLENFINMPVGMHVPVGFYSLKGAAWIPSRDGRVIRIVNVNGLGEAELDLDGDGDEDQDDFNLWSVLGIASEETSVLGGLYSAGQTLWRVPTTHLSTPDLNFGASPEAGAEGPRGEVSSTTDKKIEETILVSGFGSLDIENQVFRESIQIAGTPFSLNYASDRVTGRKEAYDLDIPLSGESLPQGVKEIRLEIWLAGRQFTYSFDAVSNKNYHFVWDGKDAYGRELQGAHKASIRIGYVYDAVYQEPPDLEQSFALLSGIPISSSTARSEWTLWQEHEVTFKLPATWFAIGQGVGGWTLNAHHAYDVKGGILHLGSGRDRTWQSGTRPEKTIIPFAGNGQEGYQGDEVPALETSLKEPMEVELAPDGSFFISDRLNSRVRMVDKDGIIHTLAGNGDYGYDGDDGPATAASLKYPWGLALRGDNELYIADYADNRIRKVVGLNGQESTITTVAGNGEGGYSGDGGPAIEARLQGPTGIAVAPDGTIYIGDLFNHCVRRVGLDGIITTFAGTGEEGFEGDGGPAVQAKLKNPSGLAIGPDGAVYIADTYNLRVRRVGKDGIITTVAGTGDWDIYGDGGPAIEAALSYPYNVVVTPDGTLYIADTDGKKIRMVDTEGIITTIAGTGERGDTGDNGPATAAMLDTPYGLAVAPDGTIYVTSGNRVRRILPAKPVSPTQEFLIPSEDGGVLYRFNAEGRHLSTLNALTGEALLTFNYDGTNRLAGVADASGKTTTIERDAMGHPAAIVGPYGQRTALTLDAEGYLATVANPASETIQLDYSTGGLLTSVTDPHNGTYQFAYAASGLLSGGIDPAGGSSDFTRAGSAEVSEVTQTTAEGRTSTYLVENLSIGGQRRLITRTDGAQVEMVKGVLDGEKREGATTVTMPTGTKVTEVLGPDPRFGMQKPIVQKRTVDVPYKGGRLVSTVTVEQTAALTNPDNPLSLQDLTDTRTFNGREFIRFYDGATRILTSMTPEGRLSARQIDETGRMISVDIPGFGQTAYAYDTQGRITTVTRESADGTRVSTFSYDAYGHLATITDPLGRTVRYQYDPVGRVTTLTRPDLKQVAYAYDDNANLAQITPPGKPPHQFSYTAIDFPDSYTAPAAGMIPAVTDYAYNKDRQQTHIIRPDGQTIAFSHNAAGRLAHINVSPGGDQVTFSYDGATGQLEHVVGPNGITQSFDYYGDLLAGTTCNGTVAGNFTLSYDQDFRLARLDVQHAPKPVFYHHDNDSLLTGVGYDQVNGMLTMVRNPQSGALTATQFGPAPHAVADSWSYNGFGELIGYAADCNGTTCFDVQYRRDAIGRITQKKETIGGDNDTYEYEYDLAGRLAKVTKNSATSCTYTYDANGNRLSYSDGAATDNGTYDSQDRLVAYGTTTYQYTANGELQSKTTDNQTTTYQYDAFGNLKSVCLPGGAVVSYLVDGNNHRVAKKVNGTLAKGFLYGGGFSPIAELDAGNSVVSLFLYGTRFNVPDLMLKNDGKGNFIPYRIITDHLGSPRLVVNALNGTDIVQQIEYDEFGRILSDTNPGFQPFGFAGGLYDPDTGLVRFGLRDYDPEVGRWTSKDPILFVGLDTNLYAYVGNDPVNRLDPAGTGPSSTGSELLLAGAGVIWIPDMAAKIGSQTYSQFCSAMYAGKGGNAINMVCNNAYSNLAQQCTYTLQDLGVKAEEAAKYVTETVIKNPTNFTLIIVPTAVIDYHKEVPPGQYVPFEEWYPDYQQRQDQGEPVGVPGGYTGPTI